MKNFNDKNIPQMSNPFNDISLMLQSLLEKVDGLGVALSRICTPGKSNEECNWLNVTELQQYLPSHPKRQTIYSWTSTRRIPFHKKGRSIMFDKSEIDSWLQSNEHIKSIDEIEREAAEFVRNKSK